MVLITSSNFTLAFAHSYIQPDTIWFGGANVSLTSIVPTESSVAFRGCMFDIGFSNTGVFQLLDPTKPLIQS